MTRLARDPRWTISRFAGKDRDGNPIKPGDKIFYYPGTKTILSGKAAEKAASDFEAARQDEEGY